MSNRERVQLGVREISAASYLWKILKRLEEEVCFNSRVIKKDEKVNTEIAVRN